MDEAALTKYFCINPTAILVKGSVRSLICDLERFQYYLIPNSLYYILSDTSVRSINDIIGVNAADNEDVSYRILGYFEFLVEQDLIFFTDNESLFPRIELEYDYPGQISNAIIDIKDGQMANALEFILQCDQILCRSVQIRFFGSIQESDLSQLTSLLDGSVIEWVEYILPFNANINTDFLAELMIKHARMRVILLYGYHSDELIWQKPTGYARLIGVKNAITSHLFCGVVSETYFSVQIQTVSEAKTFNSCLNRKIGIDINGNIKNCPSMAESYGNIRDTPLLEAINRPGFKRYWSINKDKIHVCKDCEFRYICTDCRAYIEDPEDIYSKPLKCGYNPYTGEWSEWSTNPLKQKAIEYYGMTELVEERQSRLASDHDRAGQSVGRAD